MAFRLWFQDSGRNPGASFCEHVHSLKNCEDNQYHSLHGRRVESLKPGALSGPVAQKLERESCGGGRGGGGGRYEEERQQGGLSHTESSGPHKEAAEYLN